MSRDGIANLVPYSQFQNVTFDPPIVMFSANQTTRGRRKDSVVNAEETGEFVWNMATYALREAVFGPVIAAHIADNAINANGMVDVLKLQRLARMGYYDYTFVDNQFSMVIPGMNAALAVGLEGSARKVVDAMKKRSE